MRVIFFGMEGVFSRAPLTHLLRVGIDVAAVVVPAMAAARGRPLDLQPLPAPRARVDIPLFGPAPEPTIVGIAWQASIPVFEVDRLKSGATATALASLQPDAIVVACFPRLLPPALLNLPRLGAFNVHPSLLPAYRGPEPLFWLFHDGLERAGVTIHGLDAGADSGPIAAQAAVTLPDGLRYGDAQQSLSEVGGHLLVQVLRDASADTLHLQPQSHDQATLAPVPTDADFVIAGDWTARRAYNFMRGLAGWGTPFILQTDAGDLVASDALGYQQGVRLDGVSQQLSDTAQVQLSDGILSVVVAPH